MAVVLTDCKQLNVFSVFESSAHPVTPATKLSQSIWRCWALNVRALAAEPDSKIWRNDYTININQCMEASLTAALAKIENEGFNNWTAVIIAPALSPNTVTYIV